MVHEIILAIYERTRNLIDAEANSADTDILKLYKSYLTDKYENQLNDIIDCELDLNIDEFVDVFVEDEKRIWTGLNEAERLSLLEKDFAYEHLMFLSDIAFEQAKECYDNGKYYDNDEEYAMRLNEISECLDKIKYYNVDSAKEVLSETILDIDYIFGKTEMMSLRLSRVV